MICTSANNARNHRPNNYHNVTLGNTVQRDSWSLDLGLLKPPTSTDTYKDNAEQALTLATLAHQMHLSPSRFQRLFKQTIGISPKAYQDAIRMDHFKHSIQQGSDISGAIYAAGYGSISRVYREATRSMGMTPKAYRAGAEGEQITYATTITTLGLMIMAATQKGVCFAQFGDTQDSLIGQLKSEFPNANITKSIAQNTPELNAWINTCSTLNRLSPAKEHGVALEPRRLIRLCL